MRYGCVIWDEDWRTCLDRARWLARQPQMSITSAPMRLVVRQIRGRWEAAWETRT